jgi:outer membrane protein
MIPPCLTRRARTPASLFAVGALVLSCHIATASEVPTAPHSLAAVRPSTSFAGDTSSEQPFQFTLPEAIAAARTQSPSVQAAIHRYRASYWEYVTFKADYRPSLDIDARPFDWSRTITQQTLPDGTDAFVPRSQANSSTELSLSKVVSWTGGRIALSSGIERVEALEGEGGRQLFSTPILLSYSQPLFSYNSYSWGLRIEPRRYAQARQQFVEELESVSASAISYFFDLLSAQTMLRDATTQKLHADSIYAVVRDRFAKHSVPERDVLQAELASLNADLQMTRARVDADVKKQRLGTFLGMGEAPDFVLDPPADVPVADVDFPTAIAEARRNRAEAMSFDLQLVEADRAVAQARASSGYSYLSATYGLSQTSENLDLLYRDPRADERAQLSLHMPILDWGRSRARVAVAKSQREVTRRQVEQSRADFERDVFLRVSQFDIQARQLRLAARADSVAQRRYAMTWERYLTNQDDLNSVNIAQIEEGNARRSYVDVMRDYWAAYYEVRRATLYDFERRAPLAPPDVKF